MKLRIDIRNQSTRKRFYRRDQLLLLAEKVCESEGCFGPLEISLLFCDDDFIAGLNRQYRNEKGPTDVLSFPQEPGAPGDVRQLGDIVISLETVEGRGADLTAHRREVGVLFCHGLLHLLGYDHATAEEERAMKSLQGRYLGMSEEAAWYGASRVTGRAPQSGRRPGGSVRGRR